MKISIYKKPKEEVKIDRKDKKSTFLSTNTAIKLMTTGVIVIAVFSLVMIGFYGECLETGTKLTEVFPFGKVFYTLLFLVPINGAIIFLIGFVLLIIQSIKNNNEDYVSEDPSKQVPRITVCPNCGKKQPSDSDYCIYCHMMF